MKKRDLISDKKEYDDMCQYFDIQPHRNRNFFWVYQIGATYETKDCHLLEWAEKDPKRIKWLIDKGFLEKVEELKPCPFCKNGGNVEMVDDTTGYYVFCNFCATHGPREGMKEDAAYLWNNRRNNG